MNGKSGTDAKGQRGEAKGEKDQKFIPPSLFLARIQKRASSVMLLSVSEMLKRPKIRNGLSLRIGRKKVSKQAARERANQGHKHEGATTRRRRRRVSAGKATANRTEKLQ